jgi:CheY-like chemotaxis protein
MGLSVVHGIVKSMNGAIQVCSKPGKGSEFHVYLPVIETSSQTQEIETDGSIPGGTERILLVDDETAVIALEKASLSRLGYQVTTCTVSTEALDIFRSGPDQFDLVITDMAMPKMSGDRLAVELIKIRPDIPILLCTGFSESMTDEKIKALGIRGLLFKPLVVRDLAEKIREVLDNAPTGTNE